MRKFLLAVSFCFGYSLLYAGGNSAIVIRDKSNNDVFGFFYCDEFNDLKTSLSLRVKDSMGNYSKQYVIDVESPIVIVFTNGGMLAGYPVLLYPGDTCNVLGATTGYKFQINSRGDGDANILKELEEKYGYVLPDNMGLRISNRLNVMYVVEEIQNKYRNRKQFIEDYKKQHQISQQYANFAQEAIRQKFITSLLFPFYSRQDSTGYDFNNLPSEYYSILEKEMGNYVFDDSQRSQQKYQLLLWNYCKYLSRDALNTKSEFREMFSKARTHFTGKSREFIMFLILKKYGNNGLTEYQEAVNTFFSDYEISDYKDYLTQWIPKNQTDNMLKVAGEVLKTPSKVETTWKDILDQKKGKILYIDFWASWCGPCLEEMPSSDKLRQAFESKDLEFLYISIDKNEGSWIRAIEKLEQPTENHFLLKDNSELQKVFDVSSVPRYIIIDREGRIVSSTAQRPSDPLLKNTLEGMLNK